MSSAAETLRLRVLHRQMYLDLIRAYLRDYGSQRDLARALGLTEAYLSFLMKPLHAAGTRRRESYWADILTRPDLEIVETFRFLKTPSEERASQLAAELCTEAERRDILRYHIAMAKASAKQHGPPTTMPLDAARSALTMIGDVHQVAAGSPDAAANRSAYARVWSLAAPLAKAIDPMRTPVEYTQALMFLHDTAQVWDRHDQALGHARRALVALSCGDIPKRQRDEAAQLRVTAMHAEAVSLNTLGLNAQALATIRQATGFLRGSYEPKVWTRSLLEQELTALASVPRMSIYQAETMADRALSLTTANAIAQVATEYRLLNIYISHASPRSLRKASQLAARLRLAAATLDNLTPLRRVQVLRALYRHSRTVAGHAAMSADLVECMKVTREANLFHQHRELLREASRRR
ncbi:MAG: hypothetical protein ACRDPY_00675 [Streptosporangiaceae bacterium]